MKPPNHTCNVKQDDIVSKLKWYHRIRMMCPSNPLRLDYFKSDVAVREEHQRHLRTSSYSIHPFSKFRAWYTVYLILLYSSALITKPIDAGFTKLSEESHMPFYRVYTMCIDLLCWVDIILYFFTGYEMPRTKMIELRLNRIARHYMLSPYFICDALSSLPKTSLYLFGEGVWKHSRHIVGVASVISLLKIARIVTLVNCFHTSADYFRISARGLLFLVTSICVSIMIVHWMTCLQFAIPKLVRRSFSAEVTDDSWFFEDDSDEASPNDLFHKSVTVQYTHSFFKSSAYILGIRIDLYKMATPEEYILAIVTYFIGKILITFIWIILAVAILNSRVMDIKFLEIVNQLEEYMKQKQLPFNLRGRIIQYFMYKYRKRYFREDIINNLLSENLRKEANLHVCKALIKSVSLFNELTPFEISIVVERLIPEIFLPCDAIINAGTQGDAMYFLSSGTVAVYTRSGKEICHLTDGAYFGEISLLLRNQLRLTTVVALEMCYIYRLKRQDLERYLLSNKKVKDKLLKYADKRLKETTRLEEEYKEQLLEQTFRKITAHPTR